MQNRFVRALCVLVLSAVLPAPFALAQGRKWASMGPDDAGIIRSLVIDPSTPTTLYAGTWGGGVFKTTDGGQSWDSSNNGLHFLFVQTIEMDPTNPQTLYVGCIWGSSYKTTNGGASWVLMDGLTYVGTTSTPQVFTVNPINPETVYVGMESTGAYKTTNGGADWIRIWDMDYWDLSYPNPTYWPQALAIHPAMPQLVYAGTDGAGVWEYVFSNPSSDYDGDGKSDISVWRWASGTWYIMPSKHPGTYTATEWGMQNDRPVPGDYDGDGQTDFAVWRGSAGSWYIMPSSNPGAFIITQWGVATDLPLSPIIRISGFTP